MSALQDRVSAVARSRVPYSGLSSAPVLVTIETARPGVWLVRSSDDRFGGTFVCPKVALKFVRDEAAALQCAVMVAVDGVVTMRKKSADCAFVTVAGEGFKPAA